MFSYLELILLLVLMLSLLTSIIAYLLGPNLIFGLRIGFTMIDERVWKKTHRLLMFLLLIALIIFVVASLFIDSTLLIILTFIIEIVGVYLITIAKSLEYAELITGFDRDFSGKVREIRELKYPVPASLSAVLLIFFMVTILVSILLLPKEVAVRFDLRGNPVAWQEKTEYIALISSTQLLFVFMEIIFRVLSKKYPIAVYSSALKRLGNDALLRFIAYSILTGESIISITALVILANSFNVLKPSIYFVLLVVIILAMSPFLIVYLRRRHE